MRPQIQLWNVKEGKLRKLPNGSFSEHHKEKDLEDWVEQDPSILGKELTVVGRQVDIKGAGCLDLLAVDDEGRLVVVEFKRDVTTRDAIAQILDYASSLRLMGIDQIASLPNIDASKLNSITDFDPAMILVAADVDEKAERIVDYLASKAFLAIEIVTFTYVPLGNGEEVLARSILLPDVPPPAKATLKVVTIAEILQTASKRDTLNQVEILRRVQDFGWWEEPLPGYGGALRYWGRVPSGKDKVLFGTFVGGEKLSSPQGSVDVWFNPETVAEFSGISPEATWDAIHQLKTIKTTNTQAFVRLSDTESAERVFALLDNWNTAGELVATSLSGDSEVEG